MIANPKDEDVISYIIDRCATEKNASFIIWNLIDEYTGDVNRELDIDALCVRIIDVINKDDLAIIKSYSIQANAKTLEINRNGGYIRYLKNRTDRERLHKEADIARDLDAKRANWKSNLAIAISLAAILLEAIHIFL